MTNRTTLYQYWRSSSSWRVRWVMAIKQVPFECISVDLREGEQIRDEHRERNPIGHVPVLEIDGLRLAESVAIIEYLEETRPTPRLLPEKPHERALARQLFELINSGVQPLQNLMVLQTHSTSAEEQKRWARTFNERGLRAFDALVRRFDAERGRVTKFSLSDELLMPDIFLIPQLYSARRFGADLSGLERILQIEEAALATPYATQSLPEQQPGAPTT